MNFGLAIITTTEVEDKSKIIQSLSDDLKAYFKNKQYGNDVKSYTVGIHCKNVPPGFEKFSKLPKPQYGYSLGLSVAGVEYSGNRKNLNYKRSDLKFGSGASYNQRSAGVFIGVKVGVT